MYAVNESDFFNRFSKYLLVKLSKYKIYHDSLANKINSFLANVPIYHFSHAPWKHQETKGNIGKNPFRANILII